MNISIKIQTHYTLTKGTLIETLTPIESKNLADQYYHKHRVLPY